MKRAKIQQFKALKDKFRSFAAKERELVSVCCLKVKLGVQNDAELKVVNDFLGDFSMPLTPENMDHLINFIHSQSQTLPEFLAMEESMTGFDDQETLKPILPDYDPQDAETIREDVLPKKI